MLVGTARPAPQGGKSPGGSELPSRGRDSARRLSLRPPDRPRGNFGGAAPPAGAPGRSANPGAGGSQRSIGSDGGGRFGPGPGQLETPGDPAQSGHPRPPHRPVQPPLPGRDHGTGTPPGQAPGHT